MAPLLSSPSSLRRRRLIAPCLRPVKPFSSLFLLSPSTRWESLEETGRQNRSPAERQVGKTIETVGSKDAGTVFTVFSARNQYRVTARLSPGTVTKKGKKTGDNFPPPSQTRHRPWVFRPARLRLRARFDRSYRRRAVARRLGTIAEMGGRFADCKTHGLAPREPAL